jgi:hypothetical protein
MPLVPGLSTGGETWGEVERQSDFDGLVGDEDRSAVEEPVSARSRGVASGDATNHFNLRERVGHRRIPRPSGYCRCPIHRIAFRKKIYRSIDPNDLRDASPPVIGGFATLNLLPNGLYICHDHCEKAGAICEAIIVGDLSHGRRSTISEAT